MTRTILLVFAVATVFLGVNSSSFCGNTPVVWRNDNITCPAQAVCADVFDMTRDWYNGTRCQEKRTLHNCMCPGGSVCPYDNDDHMLYASSRQKQYTCETSCSLPYCSNQEPEEYNRVTSLTAELSAREMGGGTYYKMKCRCPRHHQPFNGVGSSPRAVTAYSHRYNVAKHQYSILYSCITRGNEGQLPDQCN